MIIALLGSTERLFASSLPITGGGQQEQQEEEEEPAEQQQMQRACCLWRSEAAVSMLKVLCSFEKLATKYVRSIVDICIRIAR